MPLPWVARTPDDGCMTPGSTIFAPMSNNLIQPANGLKGMAMGMAEVVPGVSGGTIAFITGIYERLINAIKSVDGQFFKFLFSFKLKRAIRHIDGLFLINLIAGMVLGIVVAIFSITYLLEHYPPAVWAFFFGLIIASAIYILRQIKSWDFFHGLLVVLFTIIAYYIVCAMPAEGSTSYGYILLSGMIAICALMLPGISGSFILLLMGMCKFITTTLKDLMTDPSMDKVVVMLIFGVGCLTGLAGFSRLLSWTFKKYETQTLAALSGFMIGSLWKIWPWRIPTSWMDESGNVFSSATATFPQHAEHIKLLTELNVLPTDYTVGPDLLLVSIVSAAIGFAIVFLLDRMDLSTTAK